MNPERSQRIDKFSTDVGGMGAMVDGFLHVCSLATSVTVILKKDAGKGEYGMPLSPTLEVKPLQNKNTPAGRAGMERYVGWTVVSVNGTHVKNMEEVRGAMDGTDLSITLRNNKAAPSPAQHVDPTESEDAQQKRLLAQLVQAKSDNNSQTETLLHWVDKYEGLSSQMDEELKLLEAEIRYQQLENKQLLGLKKNVEASTLATLSNLIEFTGT